MGRIQDLVRSVAEFCVKNPFVGAVVIITLCMSVLLPIKGIEGIGNYVYAAVFGGLTYSVLLLFLSRWVLRNKDKNEEQKSGNSGDIT